MESENTIKEFHRFNVVIWTAIIVSVVILNVIALILDNSRLFVPVSNAIQINQIMFLIAVVIAFAILFFKRSLFIPGKLVNIPSETTNPEKFKIVLSRIRKNYIIVWALGEAIGVIGFINYILTADRQYLYVFAIVSIYSILINIPRIEFVKRCLDLVEEN